MSIAFRDLERSRFTPVLLMLLIAGACDYARDDSVAGAPSALTGDHGHSHGSIHWKTCKDELLQSDGAVCATLEVPLDHDQPNGAKIELALSKIEHTVSDEKYQGIMLVNPGGPGGSGVGLSFMGSVVPKNAGAAYDWIGFDPRGVGASEPAVNCIEDYFAGPRPEQIPTTTEIENTWLKRSEGYAAACGERAGELLEHMRTTDQVRDMDLIRAALRAPKLNFYGYSYGTYLGQVYATMFPHRIGKMVLDSNVNPTRVWYDANLDQDYAFQANAEAWWAWIAQHSETYHLGNTKRAVEQAWYDVRAQLSEAPVGGVVGGAEWTDIFLTAGYIQDSWVYLADLWSAWAHDCDATPLVAEYESLEGSNDDNGFAVYNAVQCTDVAWPSEWSQWRSDNWKVFHEAPFSTWNNAWFNAPCLYWPANPAQPVEVSGKDVPPILLLGETGDAATPFDGSLEVRRRFPNARLIATQGGTSHAVSLFASPACVSDQVADYLADGTLPARQKADGPDANCEALPLPEPDASAASMLQEQGSARGAILRAAMHRSRKRH